MLNLRILLSSDLTMLLHFDLYDVHLYTCRHVNVYLLNIESHHLPTKNIDLAFVHFETQGILRCMSLSLNLYQKTLLFWCCLFQNNLSNEASSNEILISLASIWAGSQDIGKPRATVAFPDVVDSHYFTFDRPK